MAPSFRRRMTSAEEALVHCTEQELALFGQWTRFGQGALLAKQGKITAGIDIMRSAVDALGRCAERTVPAVHARRDRRGVPVSG